MKALFHVKNSTGETWPAFGLARLGDIQRYDGVNGDVPLYDLVKPDGEDGIYVVNGASPLLNATEGIGIYYVDAQYVFVAAIVVAVGTKVGAITGQWYASNLTGNLAQFQCADVKSTANIAPVIALSSSGGGSGSAESCPCTCISDGDLILHGVETTTRWTIKMGAEVFRQANGYISFPGGEYGVVWNAGLGKWVMDIGSVLSASYLDGSDATVATTMDGELTMEWDGYNAPQVKLCITGSVPAP